MDHERKIEKMLRAYAKKRRADAGSSLKLHPANRRRLQDEVARQFAEPPEEESISLWQLFRQQWAVLLGFALVIFFVATLFMPALSKAKMKSQKAVTMSQLKEIGVAAQIAAEENNGRLPASLDAMTNGLVSHQDLTDPVSGKSFVYVAGGERLDELQSNSVLAYSPEDKKGRVLLLADGRVEAVNKKEFDEFNRRGLIQRVASPVPAGAAGEVASREQDQLAINNPAPAAAPTVASGTLAINGGIGGSAGVGGGIGSDGDRNQLKDGVSNQPGASAVSTVGTLALAQNGIRFKAGSQSTATQPLANNNSQRFVQTKTPSAKPPPVLASFEVQQNGNAIAVVDRDGSIYNGSFDSSESSVAQTASVPATPPTERNKDFSGLAKNEIAAVQNNGNFFRVAGQNRTMKQNVVFAGNVISLANANTNLQEKQQVATFANSCIMGTATIGGTNSVEINAMPVAP